MGIFFSKANSNNCCSNSSLIGETSEAEGSRAVMLLPPLSIMAAGFTLLIISIGEATLEIGTARKSKL